VAADVAEFLDIVLTVTDELQMELFLQDDHGNEIPTNYFLDFTTDTDGFESERRIRIQHNDIEKL